MKKWFFRGRVLQQLQAFSEDPDRDGPIEADPALLPVLEKLREGRRELLRRIEELTEDRDAVKIIAGNMQRELERQRESFSADLSQLRAPLVSLSGLGEKIGDEAADREEARRLGGAVARESSRLVALIDDMARLRRLDEEGPAPMTRVSLASVCRETLTSLSLAAHRRGVSLKLIGPEVWARGNAGMLNELMTCLCENAIKYNREGGWVLVETGSGPDGGTVWAAVRDCGAGIPEESFQRVFERFYRLEQDPDHQAGGTGLGLSIAKRLADCHQGSISLESAPGEGSTFTVTLPAWQEEAAPQNAVPAASAHS